MFRTIVSEKEYRLTLVFLILIITFAGLEIAFDLRDGLTLGHVLHELLILLFSLIVVFLQLQTQFFKDVELKQVRQELRRVNEEKEAFRKKTVDYAQNFSTAVGEQFVQWKLTESEVEIATLLIKGLAMKEIAQLRDSSESTVRQQAASVYRKSKLEGRQQLAAFFLEDIFS